MVQTESRHSQDRGQRELRKILGLALVSGFDLVLVWDKVRKGPDIPDRVNIEYKSPVWVHKQSRWGPDRVPKPRLGP